MSDQSISKSISKEISSLNQESLGFSESSLNQDCEMVDENTTNQGSKVVTTGASISPNDLSQEEGDTQDPFSHQEKDQLNNKNNETENTDVQIIQDKGINLFDSSSGSKKKDGRGEYSFCFKCRCLRYGN